MSTGFRSFLRSLALLAALALPVAAQTITIGAGSAASPSLRTSGSLTTGIFRYGPDTLGFTFAGTARLFFPTAGGIRPATDFSSDLGSSSLRWTNVYTTAINAGVSALAFNTSSALSFTMLGGTSPTLRGSAGDMTILAGTGAGRSLFLQGSNGAGTATTILSLLGNTSEAIFTGSVRGSSPTTGNFQLQQGATAATPPYSFINDLDLGVFRFGADTIGVSLAGGARLHFNSPGGLTFLGAARVDALTTDQSNFSTMTTRANDFIWQTSGGATSLNLSGGASAILTGGAGNMTIRAGTGNSRTLSMQVTTASGVNANVFSGSTAGNSPQVTLADGRLAIYDMTPNTANFTSDFNTVIGTPSGSSCGATNAILHKTDTRTSGICFTGTATGIRTQSVTTLTIDKGAGPGSATISGGDGSMNIIAGTGNSRTMTLQTTTSAGAAKNTLVLGADSSVTALGVGRFAGTGSCTTASIATVGSPNSGISFDTGTNDNTRICYNGTIVTTVISDGLQMDGSTSARLAFLGTTNGLRWTTAGDDSLTFLNNNLFFATGVRDTLIVNNKAKITTNLTDATGTPGTLCYNTTTFQVLKNAATDCTVSAARFKRDIVDLNPFIATKSVMAMRPSAWTYNDGGRAALGLVADNVDSVDARLGFRTADGKINSYDQAGVIALMLSTVQQLRREVDSLKAEVHALKQKP